MNKNYFTSITPIKTLKSFYFLLVISFLISVSCYGQHREGILTTSGSLEVPAGVGVTGHLINVKAWGAGGGGGGADKLLGIASLLAAGGGGGGGAFNIGAVNVGTSPDNVIVNYIVGIGGAGEISSSNRNGSSGGETSFPSSTTPFFSYTSVVANGGAGGNKGGVNLTTLVGDGGTGGTGLYSGGNGNSASLLNLGLTLISGGGGGGAGSSGSGNDSTNGVLSKPGGAGGNGIFIDEKGGSGADGLLGQINLLGAITVGGSSNGKDGVAPGGGGSGGALLLEVLGSGIKGGKGGDGQIKISFDCPTYTVESISADNVCAASGTTTVTLKGFLPVGKYTVAYEVSSPLQTGLKAVDRSVTAPGGTLSFPVTGLTTVGTSTITIKTITSGNIDSGYFCSTDNINKSVDVVVSTLPNQPSAITGYTNQCAGNTSQTYSIVPVSNATSYLWTVNTASGWEITSGQNSNSITVKVGTTAANVSVVAVNTCGSSLPRTLAVNFNWPVPTASATLRPTCIVNTGTITVTSPVPSAGISYSIDGVNYSNTTGVFALVPVGSYNVTVKYPSGCISNGTVVPMQSSVLTRTWDGYNWTPGTPTIEDKAIFSASYNEDESVTACSCEVRSGAAVTFKMGRYLKLRNELIVDGSLTFKNDASLVQINDVNKNTGVITYERETKVSRYDYTYWSSPVKSWTLKELSYYTLFDRYFSYDPDKGWEVSMSGAATMQARHGYIVRGPQTYSITQAADFTGKFTGIPNNGTFEEDLILKGNKDYLLGNPYPSAIDANKFLAANSDIYSGSDLIKPAVLKGTLYFWTHNSPPVAEAGTTTYKYAASDYASYNRTGGVTTTGGAVPTGGVPPSGKIAAGQGFFAPTSENGGKIVFNNSMRLLNDEVIDNSQFFKLGTTSKSTTEVEKNRVWLNLSNDEGAFKQTLIGYITGATNSYEGSFDGISYDGNQYVDFYSVNQGLNLSIQGRALPFQQQDSIVLGYKTTIVGDFKISIGHADGVLAARKVFLEDKVMQVLHDLKEPYSFTTEKGIFNDRFVLRYVDKNAVEEIPQELNKEVLVSLKDGTITINSAIELVDKVFVYDSAGRKLFQKNKIANNVFVIPYLISSHQILVVDVLLSNGKSVSRKIVY